MPSCSSRAGGRSIDAALAVRIWPVADELKSLLGLQHSLLQGVVIRLIVRRLARFALADDVVLQDVDDFPQHGTNLPKIGLRR